jgi:hypothetical protein
MFRHVVMIAFSEDATDEQKQALRDGLAALPEHIPEIRTYRIGDDAGLAPDNYDLVVVGDFEDRDGFLAYLEHPRHQELVKNLLRPIQAGRAAVQHEWTSALPSDLPA